jgi:hypothetical protein
VGLLEESRLAEIALPDLLRSETGATLTAGRVSPVIGAPLIVAPVGDDLVVATSNQSELIRLGSDWNTVRTLDVAQAIGRTGSIIRFGSIVERGRSILLSLSAGSVIDVIEVDVARWRVVRHRSYSGRFAAYPRLCALDAETLAMVTSTGLDLLDAGSLASRRFVRIGGAPGGLACGGGRAWVSDVFASTGRVYGANGGSSGGFAWSGEGSSWLTWDGGASAIFGVDPTAGRVFTCSARDLRCSTSGVVGRKPTSLVRVGDRLAVTLEDSRGLAVLSLPSLVLEGVATIRDAPRALALVV